MKKITWLFLCIVALTVLAIPPWNMDWTEQNAEPQSALLKPDTFVGWHDWSFIAQDHYKTIAWDGQNSGGKIGYQGTPSIAYGIYLGEIFLLIISFSILRISTRKKKQSS